MPAHDRCNHDDEDNASGYHADHDGEIVVFRSGSVGIHARVLHRVFCEAVQALERISGSLFPVEGAHRVCRALHALASTRRVRERAKRARVLHFAVDAPVACFARLALVPTPNPAPALRLRFESTGHLRT